MIVETQMIEYVELQDYDIAKVISRPTSTPKVSTSHILTPNLTPGVGSSAGINSTLNTSMWWKQINGSSRENNNDDKKEETGIRGFFKRIIRPDSILYKLLKGDN